MNSNQLLESPLRECRFTECDDLCQEENATMFRSTLALSTSPRFTRSRLTGWRHLQFLFFLFKCQFSETIRYTVDPIKTLWVWTVRVVNEHRTAGRLNWNDRVIAIWVCVVDLVFNHPWNIVSQKGIISHPSVHVKVIHLNSSLLKYCWLVYVLFDTCVSLPFCCTPAERIVQNKESRIHICWLCFCYDRLS